MGPYTPKEEVEELNHEKDRLEEQIKEVKEKLETVKNSDEYTEKRELELENTLENLRAELAEAEGKLHAFEDSYSSKKRNRKIESQINQLREEIDNINSLLEEEDLRDKKNTLDNLIEDNKQLEQETQDLKQKLSDLTSKKVGESLGEEFENRREKIGKSVKIWGALTGTSIVLLIGTAGAVYLDIVNAANSGIMLSKIALLLPVSVAVWFTSSNYSRERRLMEEYAFKSTMSYSLDGYRKVVEEELSDEHSEKMADFLSESLLKIFSNPARSQQAQQPQGAGKGIYAEIARRLTSGRK